MNPTLRRATALFAGIVLIASACSSGGDEGASDAGSGDAGATTTAAAAATTTTAPASSGSTGTGGDELSPALDVDTGCTGYDPAAGEATDKPAGPSILPEVGDGVVEAPASRWLTDRDGRVIISRGINVVSSAKGAPDRIAEVDEELIASLADRWGFNVSRHLIFWDAIEPAEGVFNERYLDLVEERLDWYAANGIWVVLDMHQDVFSACFSGDGAPEWALETDGEVFSVDPDQPWWMQNVDPAVQNAGQNFFIPENGYAERLQGEYAAAWKMVVERFADHPAVLGYDLMNEPTFNSLGSADEAADIARNLAGTPEWRNDNLIAFTQLMIDTIREVDPDGFIFVEPTSIVNVLEYDGDLTDLVDPREGPARLAYAPHLYDPSLDTGEAFDVETNTFVETWRELRTGDAERLGDIPLWVGEWGQGELPGIDDYLAQIVAMYEAEMIGDALWSYDPGSWSVVDAEGNDNPRADMFVRPYPRAVNGVPESFGFDPETKVFRFVWSPNPEASGPTEIYIPAERHYPDGWVMVLDGVESDPGDRWDAERELLFLEPDGEPHELCIAPTAEAC